MSGPNLAMTKVTTVATGLDGSDATLTPFNWTCPGVTPCSAIYFYQVRRTIPIFKQPTDGLCEDL